MKFTEIEKALQNPKEVTELYVTSHRQRAIFKNSRVAFPNLEKLHIENSSGAYSYLRSISSSPKLKYLFVEKHEAKSIPDYIFSLTELEHFTLIRWGAKSLSPRIKELQKLQVLNICDSKLESLPEEIAHLPDLKELTLDWSRLNP